MSSIRLYLYFKSYHCDSILVQQTSALKLQFLKQEHPVYSVIYVLKVLNFENWSLGIPTQIASAQYDT